MANETLSMNIKIGADPKEAIAGLQQIRKAMGDLSVNQEIFAGVDKEFKKINDLFTDLKANEPFRNTLKGGATYNKYLDSIVVSAGKISAQLEEIGRDENNAFQFKNLQGAKKELDKLVSQLNTLRDNLKDTKKEFASSLQGLGFDKEAAKTIKSEDEMIKKLKEEYEQRERNYQAAVRQAQIEASKKANKVAPSINTTAIADKGSARNLGGAVNIVSGTATTEITEGIKKGEQFEEVWKRIKQQIDAAGISLVNENGYMTTMENNYNALLTESQKQTTEMRNAEQAMQQLGQRAADGSISFSDAAKNAISMASSIEQGTKEQEALGTKIEESTKSLNSQYEAEKAALLATSQGAAAAKTNVENLAAGEKQITTELQNQQAAQDQLNASMQKMQTWITNILSLTNGWRQFRKIVTQTFNDVQKLDKAFASIAMVTDKSVEGLWKSYDAYADMANRLGQSTESAIKASALFYQQGLDTAEALSLTEDTMKLATLAGADFETATQQMTAALRGFHMEMDEGSRITDVYSELAANAAADVNGIAYAMSKTASIASNAGMDFETTAAFLTNMIETTQEAPENIGTAMKTIIARFTELKNNVSAADSEFDDLDYNKVDTALKSVGISIKDANGQFRDLDDVFLELSSKWDTLDRNTQRYIATIAAGSRQQSRFIAMMEDYERTMELVETAQNSAGRSEEQFAKYQDTVEYKLNQLKNSWEQLRTSMISSDIYKKAIDGLSSIVKYINKLDFSKILAWGPIAVFAVKAFSKNFMSAIQGTASNWSAAGKYIGDSLKIAFEQKAGEVAQKIKDKISEKLLQLKDQKADIILETSQAEQKLEALNTQLIDLKSKGADVDMPAVKELEKEIDKTVIKLNQLDTAGEKIDKKINRTNNSLNNLSGTVKTAADGGEVFKGAMSAIGSTLGMVASMAIAGADAMDIAKMALVSFATQGINYAISALGAYIAKKKAESAADKQETIDKLASAAATNIYLAAILAVVAVLALAVIGIMALVKAHRENTIKMAESTNAYLAAGKEVERLEEKQKKLNDVWKEESDRLTTLKKDVDQLSDAYKDFTEITSQAIVVQSQWDQFNADHQDLAGSYGELVIGYDSNGQAVFTQDQAVWEQVNKQAQAQLADQSIKTAQANLDSVTVEYEKTVAELRVAQEEGNLLTDGFIDAFNLISNANAVGRDTVSTWNKETKTFETGYGGYDVLGGLGYLSGSVYGSAGTGLTAEGALKGLDAVDKRIYMEIFQKALLESGDATSTFGITADSSLEDVYKNITDKLNDGNEALEQDTLRILQTALADYQKNNTQTIKAAEQAKKEAEDKLDAAMQDSIKAYATGSEEYLNASANVQKVMTAYVQENSNLTAAELKSQFNKTHSDWLDEYGNILPEHMREYNDAFDEYMKESLNKLDVNQVADDIAQVFTQQQQAYIDQLSQNMIENGWGIVDAAKQIKKDVETGVVDKNVANAWLKANAAQITAATANGQNFIEATGANGATFDQYGNIVGGPVGGAVSEAIQAWEDIHRDQIDWYNSLESANAAIVSQGAATIAAENGTEAAREYVDNYKDVLEKYTNGEDESVAMGVNWASATASNFEAFKLTTIEELQETYNLSKEQATQFFEDLKAIAEEDGRLKITFFSQADLEEQKTNFQDAYDNIVKNADTLKRYIGEEGLVAFTNQDELDKLKKALDGFEDVSSDEFLEIDEATGEIVLNADKLNEYLQKNGSQSAEFLKAQKDSNEAYKRTLLMEKEDLENKQTLTTAEKERLNQLNNTIIQIDAANKGIEEEIKSQSALNGLVNDMLGLETKITDKINEANNAVNAFKEAAKAQKENGYLSLDNITALESAFANDKEFEIGNFVNNQLQLNTKALLDYVNAKILAIETSDEFSSASQTEKLKLVALKQALIDAQKEITTTKQKTDDTTETINKVADAQEKVTSALEKVAKAEQNVIDKTNELNKILYGDELHKNKLPALYNYTTAIDTMTTKAKNAKKALEDMEPGDNAEELWNTYSKNIHGALVYYEAENQRIEADIAYRKNQLQNQITDYIKELNAKHGTNMQEINPWDYIYDNEDRLGIDEDALQAKNISSDIADFVADAVQEINNLQDAYDSNVDSVREYQKEIRQVQKSALERQKSTIEDMSNMLKEAAQKDLDTLKDKYEAMKNADDDYLNALEEAINKQRDLRDKENQWDDLATKEKKLSLMQRDTSGANQKEIFTLESEVQDDRENLLDNTIDDVINQMKELYDLQEETRQMEIEYQEALLESTAFMKMAEEIYGSFETTEDYVAWMCEQNVDTIRDASETEKELLISNWTDTGNQIKADSQILQGDINEIITVSDNEIKDAINNTSDTVISTADITLKTTIDNVDTAITKGQEALTAAIKEVQNARDDYISALDALKTAQENLDTALKENEALQIRVTELNNATNVNVMSDSEVASALFATMGDSANLLMDGTQDTGIWRDNLVLYGKKYGYHYASGGLVDYTGPAWVDGTSSKPEAFLSAEDTERIGKAAQLLANLPLFSGSLSNAPTNNGDSLIEVHINIENIGDDVDLDNALDKMKTAIWEAANPAGSSVILSK